jgi:hypothetical protein
VPGTVFRGKQFQAPWISPVDSLQPKQTLTYTIEVEGLKAGDVRFRAELRGQTLEKEMVKEASTTIYDASNGGTAPPK